MARLVFNVGQRQRKKDCENKVPSILTNLQQQTYSNLEIKFNQMLSQLDLRLGFNPLENNQAQKITVHVDG